MMASLLLASLSGFAQLEKGTWSLTPKAGVNFANMTNADGSEFRVGFNLGAEAEHALTSSSSLSFGAQYSQQGVADSDGGVDVVFQMDYINVPVMVNHYFSVSYGGESVTVSGIKKYMKNEGFDVSSFALSVPVGLAFTFGQVKMDVKYAYELTNTLSQGSEKSRHSYFQVTLGYKFDL